MNEVELLQLQNGQKGKRIIKDNSAYTGEWGLIHCITDIQFDAITDDSLHPDDTYLNIIFPQGAVIGGKFSSIQLMSGIIIVYERNGTI